MFRRLAVVLGWIIKEHDMSPRNPVELKKKRLLNCFQLRANDYLQTANEHHGITFCTLQTHKIVTKQQDAIIVNAASMCLFTQTHSVSNI